MAIFGAASGDEPDLGAGLSAAFDGRFDAARDLIMKQEHRREHGLYEGGRWPVSVTLQPDPRSSVSARLHQLTDEVVGLAGAQHWRTGRVGTAHLTVRALERRREGVGADDPAVQRYAAAMRRAAAGCGPLPFAVEGLVATPGTVMATAVPMDGRPDRLLRRLGVELADDGWLEASIGVRDIWYLNLLHFAGPVDDPERLIHWVDARQTTRIGTLTIDECRLIRWDYKTVDGRFDLFPVTLAAASFVGP